MSKLSDRLAEAKGDRSLDDVVSQAEGKGHSVHRATFAKYFAGDHAQNPRESVLKALADGLGLKVTELRQLAGKPAGELGPYHPPAVADRLNRDQRKALDELIRTIVTTKEGQAHGNSPAKKSVKVIRGAGKRIDPPGAQTPTESLGDQPPLDAPDQDPQ